MQTYTPPPSPFHGAHETNYNSIHFTYEIEEASLENLAERIPFDANKPWKLCRVPVDHIKYLNSPWGQIHSEQGVFVAGRYSAFYRVAVNENSLKWLRSRGYKFDFDFQPLEPTEAEVQKQGKWTAKCNAEQRFLQEAIQAIFSGRGPGLESCYREVAPPHRRIQFEWASLSNDVLESQRHIQEKFAKNLEFISLNLLDDYDDPSVLELLAKDWPQVLQPFREIRGDFSNWPRKLSVARLETKNWSKQPCDVGLHWVSVLRNVLEFSGGRKNFLQKHFDPGYSPLFNANLCSELVNIWGTNPFGKYSVSKMRRALSKSRLFANDDISTLEIGKLTIQMMKSLPFEYPRNLYLPKEIICELNDEQISLICIQIAHIYHIYPSLQKEENDILVLLIWGSIDPTVHQIVTKWASSDDSSDIYKRTIEDSRQAQANGQLGLILAALHQRSIHYAPSHTAKSINGSYIFDFDAILKGELLDNTRVVFESMILSIIRAVSCVSTSKKDNLSHFLAAIRNRGIASPISLDALSDRYWVERILRGLNHEDAFHVVTAELNVDMDKEEWILVPFDG